MEKIRKFFNDGLLSQYYIAKYNVEIWTKIANEYDFLSMQSESVQSLYAFIQISAVNNYLMALARLFDKGEDKKTMCIESFLVLAKKHKGEAFNINDIRELLNAYSIDEKALNQIKREEPISILDNLCDIYRTKYQSDNIKLKIEDLRKIRNKRMAHNDSKINSSDLELSKVESLLDLAGQIISIFGVALFSTSFRIEYQINLDTFFIDENIQLIKRP